MFVKSIFKKAILKTAVPSLKRVLPPTLIGRIEFYEFYWHPRIQRGQKCSNMPRRQPFLSAEVHRKFTIPERHCAILSRRTLERGSSVGRRNQYNIFRKVKVDCLD